MGKKTEPEPIPHELREKLERIARRFGVDAQSVMAVLEDKAAPTLSMEGREAITRAAVAAGISLR